MRGKRQVQKGYLIYCESEKGDLEDNLEGNEWEGRINLIKKTLKQNDQKVESARDEMLQKINVLDSSMAGILLKMKQDKDSIEEKINSMQKAIDSKMDNIGDVLKQVMEKLKDY